MQELNSLKTELENLKEQLIEAKTETDSKKLTINGSFGKFGSKYSILYSPDLLIQTTITGQLALLMLIEAMEARGVSVVSANTDGVVCYCRTDALTASEDAAFSWELDTGFELEKTDYRALYSESVNNYLALKVGGGYKGKGVYASSGLMKNPANRICAEAVAEYLDQGVPIRQTIEKCNDITKFLTLRAVKGGAVWNGEPIGKNVRWYHSRSDDAATIHYASNGNKVPKSDGARPLMDLPDSFPDDVDYDVYIGEAEKMLGRLGL